MAGSTLISTHPTIQSIRASMAVARKQLVSGWDIDPYLLSLPSEILTTIFNILIEPVVLASTTVRWMFIRMYFQTRYLPITPLPKGTAKLLLVCRKITEMILPMLYGLPCWRCDCRLDKLWFQVGAVNFASIRRMCVSVDDIGMIADAVEGEASMTTANANQTMKFTCLEELESEGYEWDVLFDLYAQSSGQPKDRKRSHVTQYMRQDALTLCLSAIKILRYHDRLSVLVQRKMRAFGKGGTMMGGSDAIDTSMGRVQWRFLKNAHKKSDDEDVVDLNHLLELFTRMHEPNCTADVTAEVFDTIRERQPSETSTIQTI